MQNRIIIIATLKLKTNQQAELKETVQALQAHCIQTEKGMLQYDWYLAEETNTIKVLETYANSEAVLHHFDNLKSFTERLGKSREFVSLEVYGDASEALRERVKKIKAPHYKAISYLNKLKER